MDVNVDVHFVLGICYLICNEDYRLVNGMLVKIKVLVDPISIYLTDYIISYDSYLEDIIAHIYTFLHR